MTHEHDTQIVILRCTRCGAEAAVPFPPISLSDIRESPDVEPLFFCSAGCRAQAIQEILAGTTEEGTAKAQAQIRNLTDERARFAAQRRAGFKGLVGGSPEPAEGTGAGLSPQGPDPGDFPTEDPKP